ncbi:MAG: DNA primase [Halieaceae bacterium]|nr:DNA primase [Halieaceae bacterium]
MAGRIPQKFLDDLLDRVDIVEVVDRRVKLKKAGKNYSACCPFHDEKTPSFTVNGDKQFYYCFGCGAGGNALGFVMDYENVDFPQAVETLANSVGMDVPREPSRPGERPAAPQESNKPLYALMEQAATFYKQQLRQHPSRERAVAYLKGRGLTGVIAKTFDLGLAPPGWDNLIKALGADASSRSNLLKTGMVVENESGRTYDRFRDRIVFPIRDQRGRVIAFGGRVLGDDKPKYLNSPETDIFHKGRELYGLYQARQAHRKLDRVLVVEGYMDVIALAQHGITYATATLGTATSETHLQRLYRHCPEVVFCFDGDEAGRKAAFRALESALPCMEDGRQAKFLFLPDGEDPDTLVRQTGKDRFEGLIDAAQPLEAFLFEVMARGIDTSSLDGRARYSKAVLPYLRKLPQGVYRELMFRDLAERTGLDLNSLKQLEAPEPPPSAPPAPAHYEGPGEGPPDSTLPDEYFTHGAEVNPEQGIEEGPKQRRPLRSLGVEYANIAQGAIALLLHKPTIARQVEREALDGIEGEDVALLREVLQLLHLRPESNTAMLLGHWYGTEHGDLLNRLAGQERLIPTEGIEQQFVDTVAVLAQLPQRSKIEAQVDKLKRADYAQMSQSDKQQLRELLQQKAQLDAARKPGRSK